MLCINQNHHWYIAAQAKIQHK